MNTGLFINKFRYFIKILSTQPLSVLRITLPLLICERLFNILSFIHTTPYNTYSLPSSSWILNILPDSLFIFNSNHFFYFKALIVISTICTVLGLLGRLNLLILSFLCLYLFGLRADIGLFDHNLSLSCQVLFLLALVPGSMKLSVDYTLLYFYKKTKNKTLTILSTNPKWGVNLILLLLVFTYLTAGVSKLRYGNGVNWFDGNTLGFYLKQKTGKEYPKGDYNLIIGDNNLKNQDKWKDAFGFEAHVYGNYQDSRTVRKLTNYIVENKFLIIALSIGSVVFELLGFIVFINSRYKNTYLLSAIIFHFSIEVLMGVWFRSYVLICLCLIDWKELLKTINLLRYKINVLNKKLALIIMRKQLKW